SRPSVGDRPAHTRRCQARIGVSCGESPGRGSPNPYRRFRSEKRVAALTAPCTPPASAACLAYPPRLHASLAFGLTADRPGAQPAARLPFPHGAGYVCPSTNREEETKQ